MGRYELWVVVAALIHEEVNFHLVCSYLSCRVVLGGVELVPLPLTVKGG